jgi:hypothetical protein
MTLVFAGLVAGFVHVIAGPDHLAAIAPYAVDGQRGAWRTGVRWGFGHASGVLGVGLLVLALRGALPVEALSAWGERLVGLALIGIGIWALWTALSRARARPHTQGGHVHSHAAFAVGTLHGLAGSAHLLGIVPALALPSNFMAGSYLLLFGTGTVVAMGSFASLVGWISARSGASRPRVQSVLLGLAALTAVAVGAFWLVQGS